MFDYSFPTKLKSKTRGVKLPHRTKKQKLWDEEVKQKLERIAKKYA